MKIIIFGCGQGGQTLGNLLSASVRLLAFADNNPQTWGKEYEGIPVISPAQIPQMDPDLVWIAIKIQWPPPLYFHSFRIWDTPVLCRICLPFWIR